MSFRKFGGLQYSAKHNSVSSYNNTITNLQSTTIGQPNSYINLESDLSGNIHVSGSLDVSGNVVIDGNLDVNGLSNFADTLTVTTGNIFVNSGSVTAVSFNTTSDYRIKEDVTSLDETFVVDELIPVTYLNKLTNKQDIGFIAHDLQKIYPLLVNGEKDGDEIQSINYTGLIPILINEIQNLKKEIMCLRNAMVINKIET